MVSSSLKWSLKVLISLQFFILTLKEKRSVFSHLLLSFFCPLFSPPLMWKYNEEAQFWLALKQVFSWAFCFKEMT